MTELDERFAEVKAVLATHGSVAQGFVSYSELGKADVLELSRAVEALSEPLVAADRGGGAVAMPPGPGTTEA